MPDISSLYELAVLLGSTAGAGIWMAFVSSWLYTVRYGVPNDFDSETVRGVYRFIRSLRGLSMYGFNLVLSLSLPVLASLAVTYVPVEVFTALQPHWAGIVALLTLFLGQQALYAERKANEEF